MNPPRRPVSKLRFAPPITGARPAMWLALAAVLMVAPVPAAADGADVVDVEIAREAAGTFRFDVTVRHGDTGWQDYADLWQVVGPDGTVYGERVLAHPHVDEQPFRRSKGGIAVPEDVATVTVRARSSADGWGGAEMSVPVPR